MADAAAQGPRLLPSRPEVFMRNQLTLQSWIILGAAGQAIITLLLTSSPLLISSSIAAAPALLIVLFSLLSFIIKASSYKPGDDGAILRRTGISFDRDEESDGRVCVLLLKARFGSPYGIMATGVKETGAYLRTMQEDLARNPAEYDFLGGSSYQGVSDPQGKTEVMGVYYFRSMEGVQKFAHSATHLETWRWWHANQTRMRALGIAHEVFEAPAGSWEAVYYGFPRNSGLMATKFESSPEESDAAGKQGKTIWASPVVDASRGRLQTSMGRMGKSAGEENGGDGGIPFEYAKPQ